MSLKPRSYTFSSNISWSNVGKAFDKSRKKASAISFDHSIGSEIGLLWGERSTLFIKVCQLRAWRIQLLTLTRKTHRWRRSGRVAPGSYRWKQLLPKALSCHPVAVEPKTAVASRKNDLLSRRFLPTTWLMGNPSSVRYSSDYDGTASYLLSTSAHTWSYQPHVSSMRYSLLPRSVSFWIVCFSLRRGRDRRDDQKPALATSQGRLIYPASGWQRTRFRSSPVYASITSRVGRKCKVTPNQVFKQYINNWT